MCCNQAQWKREVVPDHKFDFIDVSQFHTAACGTRLTYGWLWTMFIKSIAVYIADIYTLISLFVSGTWSASILNSDAAKSDSTSSSVLEVPFSIGKWIFFGCIIFSFLLLLWEARKSRAIIKSRDISYAFTNVMSQNWYALRSYDHYCFFCQIDNSKKKKDEFAFFVFFTFKGWKRLLLADAPRQVINALTLYSFGKSENWTTDFSVYWTGSLQKKGVLVTMLFTVVVWVISAALLLVAAFMYIPLLCYIQGNLKEYCCHKVDKRIAELMKRKNRKRLAQEAKRAAAEARGDYSHLKDKKTGKMLHAPMAQPTLPKIGLDDVDLYSDSGSIRAGSTRHGGGGGGSEKFSYPPQQPPTLAYNNNAPYNGSGLARHAYPYASSDSESMFAGKPGGRNYAESVTSADGFAGRGAAMGYGHNAGESSLSLVAPGEMARAPSYRTMPSSSNLHGNGNTAEYDEKYAAMATATHSTLGVGASQFGGLAFDDAPPPSSYGGNSAQPLSHSNSFRSQTDYVPPGATRQQLFERAARQNDDEAAAVAVPYYTAAAGGGGGRRMSGESQSAIAYGGWEESGPATGLGYYGSGEQEEHLGVGAGTGGGGYVRDGEGIVQQVERGHNPQPSTNNFAGRGAWGGYR